MNEQGGEVRQPSMLDAFERLGKMSALVLGVVYALGYLIVAIHHAQYGMVHLSFLRPKPLAAGLLFAVLFLVPSAFLIATMKEWARRTPFQEEHKRAAYRTGALFGVSFAWAATGCLSYIFEINVDTISPSGLVLLLFLVWTVTATVSGLMSPVHFSRKPNRVTALAMLLFAALIVISWNAFSAPLFPLYLWTTCAALWGSYVWYLVSHDWKSSLDWYYALGWSVTLLSLFSIHVYGSVRSEWGGGRPSRVIVQFEVQPGSSSNQRMACLLVDETDSGFYVVSATRQRAYFLPRHTIHSIQFVELRYTRDIIEAIMER